MANVAVASADQAVAFARRQVSSIQMATTCQALMMKGSSEPLPALWRVSAKTPRTPLTPG